MDDIHQRRVEDRVLLLLPACSGGPRPAGPALAASQTSLPSRSERGEQIGAHDLWMPATALAHELGVATGNVSHFERVPALRVVAAPG